MYTVLLADDEDAILEMLKTGVNWQELGVETLLTAQDGLAALEYFKQGNRVDLLIADIQMPRMDGLELIRLAREISPDTHFVVLTAFGEFQYAQTAIRLGVDNYLLKPISRSEMEQTVLSVLENIYQERQSTEMLLMENTLRRWSRGNIGIEELSDRAAVLGLNLYQAAYCVICIVNKNNNSSALFRSVCLEKLHALHYDANCFWDEKNRYVIIAGGKSIDAGFLAETLDDAVRGANAQEQASLAIGIPVEEAISLQFSYQTAVDAVELADLKKNDVVLTVEKSGINVDEDMLAEEIRLLLFMQEKESRENGFCHLLLKLENGGCTSERRKRLARGCIRVLVDEFPNVEGLQEMVYRSVMPEAYPEDPTVSQKQMRALLEETQRLFDEYFAKMSPVVQRTIRHIRSSVMEGKSISLKEFCAKNGMNPSYLGHLFKSETGTFFNEYLTRCRVERAAVLLRNPNLKVKDIGEKVGFAHTSYFVKCFRDNKGVSPMAYRAEELNRENI